MAKSISKKGREKEAKVNALKKELIANDEVLRKNIEEPLMQVQRGLCRKGLPPDAPLYDSLLEKLGLDIEETDIILNHGMRVANPLFEFHKDERWIEIQKIKNEKCLKALKANFAEIEKNVAEVKSDIEHQNERIKARRTQIIEELKALGEDVSVITEKAPSYIG